MPLDTFQNYLIYGTIYESDEVTPAPRATVIVRNDTKGTSEETMSNEHGQYLVDLANYPGGYNHGDTIAVPTTRGGDYGIAYTTVILE